MGRIIKDRNIKEDLTIFIVSGKVSADDICTAIKEFYENGPVTRDVLWDVAGVELAEFRTEDIRRISQVPRQFLGMRRGGKTAIIAPTDLAFGLSRMYQSSSETAALPITVKVFKDSSRASQWLAEINSRKQ